MTTEYQEAALSCLYCAIGKDEDISGISLTINGYTAKAELIYLSHGISAPLF